MHRPRRARTTAAVVLATLAATAVGGPAAAHGGEIGGTGTEYHLTNTWTGGAADVRFSYGAASDQAYVGDWDGDGRDTIAVRRGQVFHVRNSNSAGPADVTFAYGRPGDVVLVGDWDGDGKDTLAVRRGNQYFVRNSLAGGPADTVVVYGRADDQVLVGDWDGDGKDTLAVRRGAQYFLKNTVSSGVADVTLVYGRADDLVYTGDWDGDRRDTFTVRRGTQYFVSDRLTGGQADRVVVYGRADDATLVGDWNRDGRDTLGIRRPVAPPADAMLTYDRRMVELINAERAARGIAPVTWRDGLRTGAVRHSAWMAANSFQHASSATITADTSAAGCSGGWAENIYWESGYGTPDPARAMQAYMSSAGHRANILNPSFRFVATGTVQDGRETFNTQRFAVSCG